MSVIWELTWISVLDGNSYNKESQQSELMKSGGIKVGWKSFLCWRTWNAASGLCEWQKQKICFLFPCDEYYLAMHRLMQRGHPKWNYVLFSLTPSQGGSNSIYFCESTSFHYTHPPWLKNSNRSSIWNVTYGAGNHRKKLSHIYTE